MKKTISIVLALGMAFSLAACSKSGKKAESTEMKALLTDGKMVVATCTDREPFSFADESGKPTGFAVEIAEGVAKEMNATMEVRAMEYDKLLTALENDEVDMVATSLEFSDDVKEKAFLSSPFYKVAQVVIVKSESEIAAPADIAGKKVAVIADSVADKYIKENVKDVETVICDSAESACKAVLSGNADAAALESEEANATIKELTGLAALPESLTEEAYVLAVKRGNGILLDAVEAAMAGIKGIKDDNGVTAYQKLIEKYWPADNK